MWGLFRGSLELVCPLCERVRELPCELEGLVLIDLVLGDQLREKSAVHATSNVVPSGYRKKRARVVVEADGVVEACRFGHLLPKALHARGAVIEPPWRSELQNRIVTGEGSQLAGVCCLVQREEDQGELALVAESIEQRLQCTDIFGARRNVGALVAAKAREDLRVVVAYETGVNLHHQTVVETHPRHLGQHLPAESLGFCRGRLSLQRFGVQHLTVAAV